MNARTSALCALGWLAACAGSGTQQPEPKPVAAVELTAPSSAAPEIGGDASTSSPSRELDAAPESSVDASRFVGVLGSPSADSGLSTLLAPIDGGGIGLGRFGGLGARSDAGVPLLRAGNASVQGALDKTVIRRVVRRHFVRLKYCYERELQKQPDLTAKITIRFVITASGNVGPVTVQTGSGSAIDACVASVIQSMVFPAPKGGGSVIVSYPFVFQPQ